MGSNSVWVTGSTLKEVEAVPAAVQERISSGLLDITFWQKQREPSKVHEQSFQQLAWPLIRLVYESFTMSVFKVLMLVWAAVKPFEDAVSGKPKRFEPRHITIY